MNFDYFVPARNYFKNGNQLYRMSSLTFDSAFPVLAHSPWKSELEKVLSFITVEASDYNDVNVTYTRVAKSLSSQTQCRVSPQGSVCLQTLIRQVGHNNFDLDCIALWDEIDLPDDPIHFFEDVFDTLKDFGPRTKKNRCIRLSCPGKKYYLEVTPCISNDGTLWVVDREKKEWKPSNPIAYSVWFEDCAKFCSEPLLRHEICDSIDPLPSSEISF